MKEKYFTLDNIAVKAKEIKDEMEINFKHPRFDFNAKSSALLVIDMQKYFKDVSSHAFIPSFESITPNILKLIESYKKNGLPVIFTRHINTPDDKSLMAKWWRDLITQENKFSQISDDFNTEEHYVVKKSQYDAFYDSDLKSLLNKLNVKNLVVTGVLTHLCCETTARSAFIRGYKTFFTVDGTATYNESFHRNTVMNLSHGFSVPVLTQDVLSDIDEQCV